MKQFFLQIAILFILPLVCLGQSGMKGVVELANKVKKVSDKLPSSQSPLTLMFDIGVSSHGNYQVTGKKYYIVYPENADTSQISSQAIYIEKLLAAQGAKRVYRKDIANFNVNVHFEYQRDVNRVYSESGSPSVQIQERAVNRTPGRVSRNEINSLIPPYDIYPGRDRYVIVNNQGKGFSRTRYISNYSLSVVIEGFTNNGERLFETTITEYRRIPSSTTILPFMCFPALGLVGTNSEEALQFINDNPIYNKWLKDSLNTDNTIFYPCYKSSSRKAKVVYIIKDEDKTTIVLRDKLNPKLYEKTTAFLEFGSMKVPVSKYYLGWRAVNNNSPAFTIWEFPVSSNNAEVLDIVFYNKRGKEKLSIFIGPLN